MVACRERLDSASLTDRQIQCLAMRHFDGLTTRQIGQTLGITHATVARHLRYGRDRLRAAGLRIRRLQRPDEPACFLMAPSEMQELEASSTCPW